MKRFALCVVIVVGPMIAVLAIAPRNLRGVINSGYQAATAPIRDAVEKYEKTHIRWAEKVYVEQANAHLK